MRSGDWTLFKIRFSWDKCTWFDSPIEDYRLVSLAFSFVQSRSESGIEPLCLDFESNGQKRGFPVPRPQPARTFFLLDFDTIKLSNTIYWALLDTSLFSKAQFRSDNSTASFHKSDTDTDWSSWRNGFLILVYVILPHRIRQVVFSLGVPFNCFQMSHFVPGSCFAVVPGQENQWLHPYRQYLTRFQLSYSRLQVGFIGVGLRDWFVWWSTWHERIQWSTCPESPTRKMCFRTEQKCFQKSGSNSRKKAVFDSKERTILIPPPLPVKSPTTTERLPAPRPHFEALLRSTLGLQLVRIIHQRQSRREEFHSINQPNEYVLRKSMPQQLNNLILIDVMYDISGTIYANEFYVEQNWYQSTKACANCFPLWFSSR